MGVVENLAGNVLICMFVAAILNGVTLTQTFYYYQNYPNDRTSLKAVVALICFLEILHTALCIIWAYNFLIIHFGDLDRLDDIYWTISTTVVIGVLVAGIVHCYYVKRVWIMSGTGKVLTAILAFLAFMRFGFGLAVAALTYILPTWDVFRAQEYSLTTVGFALSSAAAVDVLAAGSLIYFLESHRPKGHLSDSRINFLVVYIVNTGAITSIFSILILITFMSLHSNLVFLAFMEIQSRLYANSFFASLNARLHLRNKGIEFQFSSFNFDFDSKPQSPTATRIEISREIIQTVDVPSSFDLNKRKDRPKESSETASG